jgi:hypothetical protein
MRFYYHETQFCCQKAIKLSAGQPLAHVVVFLCLDAARFVCVTHASLSGGAARNLWKITERLLDLYLYGGRTCNAPGQQQRTKKLAPLIAGLIT